MPKKTVLKEIKYLLIKRNDFKEENEKQIVYKRELDNLH